MKAYTMPIVETSVAVAIPSTTAYRITNGSANAGRAMANARVISLPLALVTCCKSSLR
jgi:hypothetical protein